jgi:hypothetical protein
MRRLLLTTVALFIAPALHAQAVAIYGTFSPLHASSVDTGLAYNLPPGSTPQQLTTSFWAPGVGGGVTLRLLPLGPVKLGLDLRGSTKPGTQGADTAMAGLQLAVHPPVTRLKFYIQASGGYLATRTVNQTHYAIDPIPVTQPFNSKFAAYEILGGIDHPLLPILDLRIIEVGAGQAFAIGTSSTSSNPTLFTLNTGLVLHF